LEVRSPSQVVRTYTIKWNVELPPNGICGAIGDDCEKGKNGGGALGAELRPEV
jgi:hypothetical protein